MNKELTRRSFLGLAGIGALGGVATKKLFDTPLWGKEVNPISGNNRRGIGTGASFVVAPSDASADIKNVANLVLTGSHDEVGLLESLNTAKYYDAISEVNPGLTDNINVLGRYSVLWLPGTYFLDNPLVIPYTADYLIHAEGTYFKYRPTTGDAVSIQGMLRSRYYFGTIESPSSGTALNFNTAHGTRRILFSRTEFTGLIGTGGNIGNGIQIDQLSNCNFIEGTDLQGFDKGIYVPGGGAGTTKTDTDFITVQYIRRNHIDIDIGSNGGLVPDSFIWKVNIDASLPNSVGIRTAGYCHKFDVITGVWGGATCVPLVLLPGAAQNIFNFRPPIGSSYQDNSGNTTNIIS